MNCRNLRKAAGAFLFVPMIGLAVTQRAGAATASDAVKADGAKIAADLALVQADEAQCTAVVTPAKKAMKDAREKLKTDAAPYEAKLQADRDQWKMTLAGDDEAIESAKKAAHAIIDPLKQKLQANQPHPADKAAAGQAQSAKAELKAARQKLEDDLKPLKSKREADEAQRKQVIEADQMAMDQALQPDTQAVTAAQKTFDESQTWVTKRDADRAVLKADQQQLATDLAAINP
ncbi:MAG TPA: hypothetical protein VFC78_01895 [Tepidisphaeraceae bacterium]|nr:hypothetical protein [Tepidisphaeraceae bacterium]